MTEEEYQKVIKPLTKEEYEAIKQEIEEFWEDYFTEKGQ